MKIKESLTEILKDGLRIYKENFLMVVMPFLIAFIITFFLDHQLTIIHFLVYSFFIPGAIGMVKEAYLGREPSPEIMLNYGRKFFLRWIGIFLVSIIIFLIVCIIYILAVFILSFTPILGLNFMILGTLSFIPILVLMSMILCMAPYSLVISDLGIFEALKRSYLIFKENKPDLFLLIVISSILLEILPFLLIIGANSIHLEITKNITMKFVTQFLNALIFFPLITTWVSRFYLSTLSLDKRC